MGGFEAQRSKGNQEQLAFLVGRQPTSRLAPEGLMGKDEPCTAHSWVLSQSCLVTSQSRMNHHHFIILNVNNLYYFPVCVPGNLFARGPVTKKWVNRLGALSRSLEGCTEPEPPRSQPEPGCPRRWGGWASHGPAPGFWRRWAPLSWRSWGAPSRRL